MANNTTQALNTTAHPFGLEALTVEIQCYALPFGILGSVSHALTLYTAVMLAYRRSPLFLMKKKSFQLDAWLAGVGLLIVLATTIATMVKCRQRWEFVLIAGWKLALSVSFNGLCLAAAGYVQSEEAIANPNRTAEKIQYEHTPMPTSGPVLGHSREAPPPKEIGRYTYSYTVSPFFGDVTRSPLSRFRVAIGFQAVGCLIGIVGLQALVRETWDHVHIRRLCYAFGGGAGLFVVLVIAVRMLLLRSRYEGSDQLGGMLAISLIGLGVLALFWSDWVLAFIKQDVRGAPDGNNAAIGWLYFAAKRLTMIPA